MRMIAILTKSSNWETETYDQAGHTIGVKNGTFSEHFG